VNKKIKWFENHFSWINNLFYDVSLRFGIRIIVRKIDIGIFYI